MSYSVVLPEGYGYVIAAGAFCGIALTITGALAGQQRKRLGVEYPNLYASDLTAKQDKKAYEFNCAQRGAMNPHESYATALFGLAFGGLSYPLVAAGAGAAFGVGSILYYLGYSSGDPKSRYNRGGIVLRLGTIVLQVLPFITAYGLIRK